LDSLASTADASPRRRKIDSFVAAVGRGNASEQRQNAKRPASLDAGL
jgi:hypothetical protein